MHVTGLGVFFCPCFLLSIARCLAARQSWVIARCYMLFSVGICGRVGLRNTTVASSTRNSLGKGTKRCSMILQDEIE